MATIAFQSGPLPRAAAAEELRCRLHDAHTAQPFSTMDPRNAAHRAADIAEGLGFEVTMYRGGLDLDGSEIDHVWVDLQGRVIDVAFPLFVPDFVSLLRGYVAGDVELDELAVAAEPAGVDLRVLGTFPARVRYRGAPVWSQR